MRLNKFLSKAGIASRRGADQLLSQGRVAVNGEIVTALGSVIDENIDSVTFDGKPVEFPKEHIYLILHKPVGCLVTRWDRFNRPTVMSLIGKYANTVKPVGRLDFDSSGLLVMTDDGEFAFRLSHPRFEIDKKYLVKCEGYLSDDEASELCRGINLEDGLTSPAKLEIITRSRAISRFFLTIHEGKKRQIRRMCRAVGREVLSLKRVAVGNIELGDLRSGRSRILKKEEIDLLKKSLGL